VTTLAGVLATTLMRDIHERAQETGGALPAHPQASRSSGGNIPSGARAC